MQSITVQGASVYCIINGIIFGRVTGFSFNSETQRKALYTIDSHDPVDLVPTVTRITGKIDLVRTKSDGGLEGAGIVAPYEYLSNEKFITIMILAREDQIYRGGRTRQVASFDFDPSKVTTTTKNGVFTYTNTEYTGDVISTTMQSTPTPAYGNRTVIFRTDNAQVTSQSWQVAARGLMTGSFNFEAITWSNEVENAF